MVVNAVLDGQRLVIGLKPAAVNVMFSTAEVVTYDRGGRLWLYADAGRTFRRGLDGAVLEKWVEHGQLVRRRHAGSVAHAIAGRCAARIRSLLERIDAAHVTWETPPPDALRPALARAARFDAAEAARDAEAFTQVYDPVGILPPDQYVAVVLQATAGCSFNSCTFCDFYKTRRFQVKSPAAFREHARAVRAFLGDSILLRKSIFLGEANALAVPEERLLTLLEIVREEFGPWPVHAFQDGFSGQRKSVEDYRRLAALGLRRVSIGMESGHDPLLRFVRKPGNADDVAATVTALKEAGVAVNLIVLIGLGGDGFAASHRADTAALLNRLPLGKGDIIYFSDLTEHERTPYPSLARAAGLRPLTAEALRAQRAAIRAELRFDAAGPTLANYDIHEFIY